MPKQKQIVVHDTIKLKGNFSGWKTNLTKIELLLLLWERILTT